MEILCVHRKKKTAAAATRENTKENHSDMIQMNNKIVYCVKDHHGVSIKTSKKRRQSDAEKEEEKNVHKTAR